MKSNGVEILNETRYIIIIMTVCLLFKVSFSQGGGGGTIRLTSTVVKAC